MCAHRVDGEFLVLNGGFDMTIQELYTATRPIPGFSGYFISRCGVVYSTRSSEIVMLTQRLSSSGYISVTITDDNENRTSLGIHRLLALSYVPKRSEDTEVNHIDGNKLNNDLSNLEWTTRSGNEWHKVQQFMTNRTCPVYVQNCITAEIIVVPSMRIADKMIGAAINTVSRQLQLGNYGFYDVYMFWLYRKQE